MTEERWSDGRWFQDCTTDFWCYLKPGYYEAGLIPDQDNFLHRLNSYEVESLIRKLDEAGWIKPRLDERLRTEDLKITHRLLDLLDNSIKQ